VTFGGSTVVRRPLAKFWGRRKLLALVGLGAGVAAQAGLGSERTAHATGPVIGTNNYSGSLDSAADGVQGYAVGQNNAGTFGRNNDLSGVGVYGAAPNGIAVHGESATGTGVGARSSSGNGVLAQSSTGYGVFALSTTNYAVHGNGQGTTGYGVLGYAGSTIGVAGSTYGGTGVHAGATTGTALYAQSTSGSAGVFIGPVQVQGSFTVTGGPKSAAVPHPDGSHRRMYCVESPESFFEDVGSGQLVSGRAQVRFDADFAAVVKTDDYQVFTSPEGDCKGLYVTAKTVTGFEVRELQAGTSSISFSYRVLAKRKDLTASRMERVEIAPRLAPLPSPSAVDDATQVIMPSERVTPVATPASTPSTSTPVPTVTPRAIPTTPTSPTPVSPPNAT
jgi:hypothetical protein